MPERDMRINWQVSKLLVSDVRKKKVLSIKQPSFISDF
jgi:hypothetical protein